MAINDSATETPNETEPQGSGRSTGFGSIKTLIINRLRTIAEAIGENATAMDGISGQTQCAQKTAEWLDHSTEFIQRFDYKQVSGWVRESVRQKPGRSLLVAGAVGLILGAIIRRR